MRGELIKEAVIKVTNGKIVPMIEVVDKGIEMQFTKDESENVRGNIQRLREEFDIEDLKKPSEIIFELVSHYMKKIKK